MLDLHSSSILLQPLVYYSTFVLNLWFCLVSKTTSFCQLNRQYLCILFIDHPKNKAEITCFAFLLSATITTIPNLISNLASEVHMTWQWKHSGSGFKRCFLPGYKQTPTALRFFLLVPHTHIPPPPLVVGFFWFIYYMFQISKHFFWSKRKKKNIY